MFAAEIHFVKVNYIRVQGKRDPRSRNLCACRARIASFYASQIVNRIIRGLGRECYTKWKLYAVYEGRTPGILFRLHSDKTAGRAFTAPDKYSGQIKSTILSQRRAGHTLN